MTQLQQPSKAIWGFAGRLNHPAQAGCTKNFIGMFRDALPAEKTATLGTARNRLPLPMIVTTLVSNIGHIYIKIVPVIIVNSFARSYQYVWSVELPKMTKIGKCLKLRMLIILLKTALGTLATKMYYKLQSQAQIIRQKVEIKTENQPSPCA